MHRERLSQMVTMLRGLPPEKKSNFDISEWHCGTSACAVGAACFDPWFNEQGLCLNEYNGPSFGGLTAWEAVEDFFDLFPSEARDLFYGGNYPKGDDTTPEQVADRIEAFIAV